MPCGARASWGRRRSVGERPCKPNSLAVEERDAPLLVNCWEELPRVVSPPRSSFWGLFQDLRHSGPVDAWPRHAASERVRTTPADGSPVPRCGGRVCAQLQDSGRQSGKTSPTPEAQMAGTAVGEPPHWGFLVLGAPGKRRQHRLRGLAAGAADGSAAGICAPLGGGLACLDPPSRTT